jgi:hypothetical protein
MAGHGLSSGGGIHSNTMLNVKKNDVHSRIGCLQQKHQITSSISVLKHTAGVESVGVGGWVVVVVVVGGLVVVVVWWWWVGGRGPGEATDITSAQTSSQLLPLTP